MGLLQADSRLSSTALRPRQRRVRRASRVPAFRGINPVLQRSSRPRDKHPEFSNLKETSMRPTAGKPQTTDFTQDVLGRYICNGMDEALNSTDKNRNRLNGEPQSDARPFDIIVIGGGSFGGTLAQHLLFADKTNSHRILVLEAGSLVLPEHVQNLPVLGLNVPGPTEHDPFQLRNEVWGLPWRSDVRFGFTGLAYCVGGRSAFFGGWG